MKAVLSLFVLSIFSAVSAAPQDAGRVSMMKRPDPRFDVYTNTSSSSTQQWMRDHYTRMEVFSPYFDGKTSWYAGGLMYLDSYAIYTGNGTLGLNITSQHPEWILRNASGNRLFIPWGCGGGTCPQYAADISNPGYRRQWIDYAKQAFARGAYKGLWIDDVNMDWRISDGWGNFSAPVDSQTGAPMTLDAWRRYMAEFMEQVRAELPTIEILHNSLWYAGADNGRDQNPYIRRQIAAADLINIEHGVNDRGLGGGTGEWSLNAVLAFVDRVHAAGKRIVIDGIAGGNGSDSAGREYAIACYFLISNGSDLASDYGDVTSPDAWWSGFDANLGAAAAPRYSWNGLLRRDFTGGVALVNEPGAPWRTVALPSPMRNTGGAVVSTVTLGPGEGAFLRLP